MNFDQRITPARPDLAALSLKGKVEAAHFADGTKRQVIEPQTPLRRAPAHDAALDTEALHGEIFTVYETTPEGWCWGQLERDGYVGYLSENALAAPGPAPTHRVGVLRTLVFPGPNIKLPPIAMLPLGATLAVTRSDERFAVTASGAHLPVMHLRGLDAPEKDFVAVAERFLGTSYLWGGKSNLGIDCSGLVQIALTACGIDCPRDSDMQEKALGHPVDPAAWRDLKRGDLVFWKGHVAIARDATMLLHANAFHMAVTSEPAESVIARAQATDSAVTAIRRLAQ